MGKIGKIAIYPFLLAIFPVLFLFNRNIEATRITDTIIPIAAMLAVTTMLFLPLKFITKSYTKSGIVTLWFLILFYTYSYINTAVQLNLISRVGIGDLSFSSQFILAPLWAILFIVVVLLIRKCQWSIEPITAFLNIASITIAVISIANIGITEIGKSHFAQEEPVPIIAETSNTVNTTMPDIYYIILDTYTRQDTLLSEMGYDNSTFIDYLENSGFYVASKSCSNYPSTDWSMPSSLNMRYLAPEESTQLGALWQDSEVTRILKSKGYKYITIQNTNVPKGLVDKADVGLAYKVGSMVGQNELLKYLLYNTALQPFTVSYFEELLNENDRQARLFIFDELLEIPSMPESTFTYAHIMLPHPPFIFDRDGNPPQKNISDWMEEDIVVRQDAQYVEQLIFTNSLVVKTVDKILADSDIPPIIILQGDHGAYWGFGRGRYILNAYYLPGKDNQLLYPSISPVNSFRVLFNLYFEGNYELLEDCFDALETTR